MIPLNEMPIFNSCSAKVVCAGNRRCHRLLWCNTRKCSLLDPAADPIPTSKTKTSNAKNREAFWFIFYTVSSQSSSLRHLKRPLHNTCLQRHQKPCNPLPERFLNTCSKQTTLSYNETRIFTTTVGILGCL